MAEQIIDYNKINIEKDILRISINILKKEKQNLLNLITIIRGTKKNNSEIEFLRKSVIRHRQLKRAIGTIESLFERG
jgi:hypothetical protein